MIINLEILCFNNENGPAERCTVQQKKNLVKHLQSTVVLLSLIMYSRYKKFKDVFRSVN